MTLNTPDAFGEMLAELSLDANALEIVARAYDREDAAQRGEADPWESLHSDLHDREFMDERMCCALTAIEALCDYWRSMERSLDRKAAP